ncbi:hypothetical protein [Rahnella perminowiae]|uniref:hypothetical protein n=1 Tax=Rahnella perminowiae TaxID=2816244 RepID=UPI00215CA10C|nr:hypothetical protein [Rahnella perminowiae]MCR9003095.1 hypothetical protein [Rahnella perminowiae]
MRNSYLFSAPPGKLIAGDSDEQTQTLPSDELNQARLAWGWITPAGHSFWMP